MISILKTSCLIGATLFFKPARVVAQPMLGPVAWGSSGGNTQHPVAQDVTGVTKVSCGGYACAGFKTDGSVIVWGDSRYGGDTQGKDLTDVVEVVCGGYSCAGLKSDTSVVCWGYDEYGADTTVNNNEVVTDIVQLTCGWNVCGGVKSDGSVLTWGYRTNGGISPTGLTGVAHLVMGGSAIVALKIDGSIVAWGDGTSGGHTQGKDVTDIVQVVCGPKACAGLKSDGSAVAWGHPTEGGDTQSKDLTGITQISCGYACAALKSDGSVVVWGDTANGGDTQGEDVTDIVQVVCGKFACAGLKSDGSVVAWGASAKGGDTQGEDVTDVVKIACAEKACAGLKSDGSVVAWGNSGDGGDLQGQVITGANKITSSMGAFVVWYAADSAGGGGDPHFIGFGGIYFTYQGHCDLILVKSTKHMKPNTSFEVHVRLTRVRKWSKIDTIAVKVDQNVVEITSKEGKLIFNGNEVEEVENKSFTIVKSKLKEYIHLYMFSIHQDKKLEVKVNTRSHMIYTALNGNYPRDTKGILGSPYQPGLVTRNGVHMPPASVNTFAETWQVRDTDPHLFTINRAPQYPSTCWYGVKNSVSKQQTRHLKQLQTVWMEEATAVCSTHHPGPLLKFCIDDVVVTGDLDSAKDEFYD